MRAFKAKSLGTLSPLLRSAGKTSSSEFKYSPPSSSFSEECSSRLHSEYTLSSLKLKQASDSEDPPTLVYKRICSILHTGQAVKRPDPQGIGDAKDLEKIPDISWFSNISHSNISLQRKEVSRERKRKSMFEFVQVNRFGRLVRMCADKLGTEAMVELFGKLGRELGVKDYNALIGICIDKARETDDEEIVTEEMGKAFLLFKLLREQGFPLEEQTYRPLLLQIIDKGMVEEFQIFNDVIKDKNPSSISRLGYYEMMLWLRVNNEEKIQDLCNYIVYNDGEDTSDLRESYLLALCESDRKKEISQVLETIDIKKLSSSESIAKMFQSLGRLLLEPVAEKFLLDFKICDHEAANISNFIASYAVSIPNLAVEDVFSKFKELHQKLKVSPSSSSYEKLILYSRDLLKYYEELKRSGFQPTKQIFTTLIDAYAACGQLEKVKQVILDPLIPEKMLNEIKSMLVSVLASHGQLSEAFLMYEEIKQTGKNMEPKAVMSLIEHTQSDGELDRLLLLLEELCDPEYWNDGCCRIILYCVWNKHLSSAVDLCKQLKDKFQSDELVMEVLFDKVFSQIEESELTHLQTGLGLLWEMKDKLSLLPSKKCLDYLLSACNLHNFE